MRCLRCGVCCRETEMPLSTEDIERIERKGFSKEFFVQFRDGYAILRNLNNYCVFYDVENQRCAVYHSRPLGCRLYPVVYDEQKGIIVDEICLAKGKGKKEKIARRGWKVLKLLERIDAEAEARRNLQ